MKYFTTLLGNAACVIATVAVLFLSDVSFGQKKQSPLAGPLRPDLGTASTYAVFTGGGAINNTGLSKLTGDVGQDGAYDFNGFPPGTYTGALNRNNGASALAKQDLINAQTADGLVACDIALGAGIADGQSFDPKVYCSTMASTTTGNITFDAHGDGNAIFIVKIGGQLDANAGTHILLANNAKATNIYWFVDGAVNIADNSTFKGVIVATGAITFLGTSSLDGRALTTAGAINLAANSMGPVPPGPGNNITIITPAQGDSLKSGTKNYKITWSGSGIASQKIFEYSLDNGLTWKVIDTITSDGFTHDWTVPDTTSTQAVVRITDGNNLRGVSGLFTIGSSKSPGPIIVVRPALGEIIIGGTQNYQITWTGIGLASMKTFDLSLDGGATWQTIGTITADVFTFNWNVPDIASTTAVIRITDQSNNTGKSGVFTITSSKPNGSIVVIHPATGDVIGGGMQNYLITFTAINTAAQKILEYSLDGGATWNLIGFLNSDAQSYSWANVPNMATTQALVRITDANGVTGKSGLFTITFTPGAGSINSVTLSGLDNKNNIGNNKTLGISWTYTPDIGTSVEVEASLDGMVTWTHVATVQVSESSNTTWITPIAGKYNPVFIRVTSSLDKNRISAAFSIGANASVSSDASKNGYSVSNYPNPASSQTTIKFVLPVASDLTLRVIDGLGREVEVIASQRYEAGSYNIKFNTSMLAQGMYSYILQAGATKLTGKMSIVK